MRPIKFRAWVKDKKLGNEMFRVVSISWLNDGEVILSGRGGSVHLSDCELMQFTGLHDKNGKEIWEGDIFTHTSWVQNQKHGCPKDNFQPETIEGITIKINQNPYPVHIDFHLKPYRVVKYVTDEGYTQRAGFIILSAYWPKDIEVLGNIYEHPELLK